MSTCPGRTYVDAAFGGAGPFPGLIITSATYMDGLAPQFLIEGYACDLVKSVMFDSGHIFWNTSVPDGTAINNPGFSSGDVVNPNLNGTTPAFESIYIGVKINDIDVGTFGWTGIPGDDGNIDSVEFDQTIVFTWPIIFGASTGINKVEFYLIGGIGCDGVSFPSTTVPTFTSFSNYDAWWCCTSTAYHCCGGGGPFLGGGQFLIPRPSSPTDVQLNSSVPITDTPLYLANHTFQFVPNYGRVQR